MNAVGDILMRNVTKTIQRAASAATNEVILRTPVATGNARVNWRVGLGQISSNLKKPPATESVDTNRQVASAEALINAANVIKVWKVGKGHIFIGNPVDYISDLDDGTSQQARAGMTVFAIAAARDILRKGRLLRGR